MSPPTGWTIVSVFSFLNTVYQTSTSRRREKRQFHSDTVKRVNSSPGSRNAVLMLYHRRREVPLFANPADSYRLVTESETAAAVLQGSAVIPLIDKNYVEPTITGPDSIKEHDRRLFAIIDSFYDLIGQLEYIRMSESHGLMDRQHSAEMLFDLGHIFSTNAEWNFLSDCSGLLQASVRLLIREKRHFGLILFFADLGYDIDFNDEDLRLLSAAFPEFDWQNIGGYTPLASTWWMLSGCVQKISYPLASLPVRRPPTLRDLESMRQQPGLWPARQTSWFRRDSNFSQMDGRIRRARLDAWRNPTLIEQFGSTRNTL